MLTEKEATIKYLTCCEGNITWDDLEIDDTSIYYPGKCDKCGTEYQEVYTKEGVVNKETQSFVEIS